MLLNVSLGNNDELDHLLTDSALAAIDADAPLIQIETALRSLAKTMIQADPLGRAMVREAAIRRLRAAGVRSPAALTDAAFGPETPEVEPTMQWSTAVPWERDVDGSELLDEITGTFRRFIALSAPAADAQALWCLHTYASEASGVSPVLCIRSPEKRCGKTRNLEVLSCLTYRPLHTANITVAALYRTIDHYHPTLLIDEADTIFVNGSNAELRGILNAGLYRSTGFVLRCLGRGREPKRCSVWCPKAIALIGRLPSTLEDRSIVISLLRRTHLETVEAFHYENVLLELEPIRRRALRWAGDRLEALQRAIPAVPASLNDRAQDIWRPLLAIADAAGGNWPERARRAAVELSGEVSDQKVSSEQNGAAMELLHDVRTVFHRQQADRLPSETIITELATMHRWRSEKMTKIEMARLLAPLGIRPKVIRHGHRQVSRGYLAADFADSSLLHPRA